MGHLVAMDDGKVLATGTPAGVGAGAVARAQPSRATPARTGVLEALGDRAMPPADLARAVEAVVLALAEGRT